MNVLIQPPSVFDWLLCEKKNVLSEFGVSLSPFPLAHPSSFHLEARANGVIWGGISAFRGSPLPCEKYVPYEQFVAECRADDAAELCGLWVRKEARGFGLGPALMQAMIAVLRQQGVCSLFACGHERLFGLYGEGGLRVDSRFAGFTYPTPEYTTYCLRGDLAKPWFSTAFASQQFHEAQAAFLKHGRWLRAAGNSGTETFQGVQADSPRIAVEAEVK